MTWQPIETAPKDELVIVWVPIFGRATVGQNYSLTRGKPGWHVWGTKLNPHTVLEPTHWMPLPEPPTDEEGMQ